MLDRTVLAEMMVSRGTRFSREGKMKFSQVMQFVAVTILGAGAWAQTPKTELALDYSFARYAPSASYTQGHSLNGGGGTFKYNFGHSLGIAMDLQGYNSNT